jgi:uncharacterized membrane protein
MRLLTTEAHDETLPFMKQLCRQLRYLLLIFLAGCASSEVDNRQGTISGSVTTGAASFTLSPQLSSDLRLVLGDAALAAATNAISKYLASTPTGAASEAASKAVDAAAESYKQSNSKELDATTKAKLTEQITQELKKKLPAVK